MEPLPTGDGADGMEAGTVRQPHTEAAPDEADLNAKALLVHDRLCQTYGCPVPYFHDLDPLSEIVSSLLSHRTRNADSGRAFKELRRRLPTWEQVRDAPTPDVEDAIVAATWPEQKAPRLQQVLRMITERRGGSLSLDFLREMTVPNARAWLEALPGVGPKTSAAVLSFSTLRMAALPVDCHHHRVAQRLALIGATVGEGPAHAILAAQLPPEFTPQQVYDNHQALMRHGQQCCYHASPACERCPVLDLCPHGQARANRRDPARAGDGDGPPPGKTAQVRAEPSEAPTDLFGQHLERPGTRSGGRRPRP